MCEMSRRPIRLVDIVYIWQLRGSPNLQRMRLSRGRGYLDVAPGLAGASAAGRLVEGDKQRTREKS
jgi:hypothetical protein